MDMCGVKYENGHPHTHTPIYRPHTLIRTYTYSHTVTHTHTHTHTRTHARTQALRAYFAFRTGDDGAHGLVEERAMARVRR